MEVVVFDVAGEYGMFKKPYSPLSPVSFPIAPPTAILGMVGAILGFDKSSYLTQLNSHQTRVGVSLRQPVQTRRAAINWLNTNKLKGNDFRPKAGENNRIQIPCEFLYRPAFRCYLAQLPEAVQENLISALAEGTSHYQVVLGWANCLAEVQWVGCFRASPCHQQEWQTHCAVALTDGVTVEYQHDRRYQRFRLPAQMDQDRVVHRYPEVVIADDAKSIKGRGGENFYYLEGEGNATPITFL